MFINSRNFEGFWAPIPGGNAAQAVGLPALTVAGTTLTARTIDSGLYGRHPRLGLVGTGTTAGSVLSLRHGVSWLFPSSNTGSAGFMVWFRFAIADAAAVANARMFLGLTNATGALINVDPATLTNCIGIGHNSGAANLSIYFGGTSAQTPIDLGSNFPANTRSTDYFDVTFASFETVTSAHAQVHWHVSRNGSSTTARGSLSNPAFTPSVIMPSGSTALGFNGYRTNNTSTGAVSLDLFGLRMGMAV